MDEFANAVAGVEHQAGEFEPEGIETLNVIESEPVGVGRKRSRRSGRAESRVAASPDSEGKESPAAPARPRRKKAAAAKKTEGGAELASLMVELANLLAQTVYGPQAAMNPIERGMIEPSLGNILERTPPETVQRVLGISDALMFVFGSALWASRLRSVGRREEKRDEKPVEAEEPVAPTAEENGVELGKVELEMPEIDELWVTKLG